MTDTETLPLSIDAEQYERIKAAEAVVITHYTGPGGRFAKLRFIGSMEECELEANTPRIILVAPGVECEGSMVVPVAELIPPEVPA